MSTITTTNFEAGEITDRAATNTKFSAVATATGSINEDNVRSEGIDKRQLAAHAYSTGRMEPLVHLDITDNLSGGAIADTAYNGQTGQAKFDLTGGSDLLLDFTSLAGGYLAVATGDLIRIHYTIYFKQHSDDTYTSPGEAHGSSSNGNPADGIGLVVFPTWKLTGGGAHAMLPNEVDLVTGFGPSAGVTFNGTTAKTDSISFVSLEGGNDTIKTNLSFPERMVHGTWNYIADQAYTVYELRLSARGPMVYQAGTAAGNPRQLYAPTWGADRYKSSIMDIPSRAAKTFDLTFSNGQLGIMVMRGDS